VTQKKVAVLGGGNGAHMMAADFVLRCGHIVNMFEMPAYKHNMAKVFETKQIEAIGELQGIAHLNLVTDNIEEAVEGCDYICLVAPAFTHKGYAELLAGKLKKNQIVVTFPGAFCALEMKKAFEGCEEQPIFADASNLPYDTRLAAPGKANLLARNGIKIAFMPAEVGPALFDQVCEDLFPFQRLLADVLESGLSIVNPSWHSGPCLLNVSNIERPDVNFYDYEHGWTPSACKVNIALDNERKAVGEAFGYHITSHEESGDLPEGYTWQQLYMAGHGHIGLTPICGPNSIHDRYLTEDAPYGLVPWAALGELAGVPMPIIDAVINLYNIIHETDWRAKGNTLEKLGLDGMTKEQVMEYVKTGRK